MLVTGASAGIGAALCRRAVARGWRVTAWARRSERLTDLQSELGAACHIATVDVTDAESIAAGVASAVATHGAFNAIVANAGRGVDGEILDLSVNDISAVFDVNVLGVHRCLQATRPHWADKARIIIVSSIVAYLSIPRMGAYCATKHAVDAYAAALRVELAASGHHVCTINPGTIDTEFFDVAPTPGRQWTWRPGQALRAERVARAMERVARGGHRRRIVLPGSAYAVIALARLCPAIGERLLRRALGRMRAAESAAEKPEHP
ncbi:MAG: SDR family NAD(P)-dependent oxidoreductase [Planctomycetota bacterium]|jgi:NADP-dependent 3-hydroxy acid dehydrogenase YdfG|nr:SDR family NAD(P)-dependent oxidoreductase [Planctomycetota bacterium]